MLMGMTTLRETARDLFDLVDHNAREAGAEPVPQATVDTLVEAGLHAVMTPAPWAGWKRRWWKPSTCSRRSPAPTAPPDGA